MILHSVTGGLRNTVQHPTSCLRGFRCYRVSGDHVVLYQESGRWGSILPQTFSPVLAKYFQNFVFWICQMRVSEFIASEVTSRSGILSNMHQFSIVIYRDNILEELRSDLVSKSNVESKTS